MAPPPAPRALPGGAALARWLDIRRGERVVTGLLTFAAFAVICSYCLLKPVSRSIFLSAHAAEDQRFAFMYVAVATTVFAAFYIEAAKRFWVVPLVNGVFAGLVGVMVLFWFGLRAPGDKGLLAYGIYAYSGAFGVVSTAMFWLTVNHLLEPRQARRLVAYLGAGAIAGGIASGPIVAVLVKPLGTNNLLWVAGGCLLLALAALDVAFGLVRPPRVRRMARQWRSTSTLRLIAENPYLRLLMVLIAVTMLCVSLGEYQYTWVVKKFVAQGDATTSYMATWNSVISALALPLQVLVTAPLLRRFGVAPALLVLPLVFVGLSGAMAFWPTLVFGTGLSVGDGAVRYSVNKSAVELLYLPLPLALKDRTKVFIDTVMDRIPKGLAGLLLVLFLDVLKLGITQIAAVTGALGIVWGAVALLLRRRYVGAFREALGRGSVDLSGERIRLDEPAAFGAVRARLRDANPAVVRQALDLLLDAGDVDAGRVAEELAPLAEDVNPAVASRALRLGARAPTAALVAIADRRVGEADVAVAAAAAHLLHCATPAPADSFVGRLDRLGKAGEALSAGAVFAEGGDVPDATIDRLLADQSEVAANARLELARALCRGALPHRRELVRRLMADADPAVAEASLSGAGALGDRSLIPFLVTALRRSTTRRAARAALVDMGAPVLPVLEAYLWDPRIERAVRLRLPRAIGQFMTVDAHHGLVRALGLEDPALRHQALKSLNRMAKLDPALHVPASVLESEILAECHDLARLFALVGRPGGGGPRRRLFERAVRESIRAGRERLFRLLGLRGPARDWENAHAAFDGDDTRRRATAVEFADRSLTERLRRVVVPLIDDIGASEALQRVGRHLEVTPLAPADAYVVAARGHDGWLAACARAVAAEEGIEVPAPAAATDPFADPWTRDAAGASVAP